MLKKTIDKQQIICYHLVELKEGQRKAQVQINIRRLFRWELNQRLQPPVMYPDSITDFSD